MDSSGIAGMASAMSGANLIYQASLAVTAKAMDTAVIQAQGLVEMLDAVPAPLDPERILDVYA